MIKLLIDSDPIVYRSGFAAESVELDTVLETASGELQQWYFKPGDGQTALQQLNSVLANGPATLVSKERIVKAEPVEHALQIVGSTIDSIKAAVKEKFDSKPDVRLVLSGPGNYRYKIATIKPYKGNRDPSHIPVHYQAIRNYLTDIWRARVIHGREADDEVSIEGWKLWRENQGKQTKASSAPQYVVASIDKDLDQIPGWHYDYMKKVFYFVDEESARKQLWTQILAGDSGDNIPGCWRIGYEKAAEIIQREIDRGAGDLGLWLEVQNQYTASKEKKGCPYPDKFPPDVATETAQLVYMQQRPGELWQPPGTEFGTVTGDVDD